MSVLVAVLTVFVLALLGSAVLALVTALPFVVGVDLAERRGFSTDRWGAACVVGSVVALLAAYELHHHHVTKVLVVAVLLVAWVVPVVLSLLSPQQRGLGGPSGAHLR